MRVGLLLACVREGGERATQHPPSHPAGRRFTVKVPPMAPLARVVEEVLPQLNLADPPAPDACKLLLKGRALELGTPVRFANIGRDKLELVTGEWEGGTALACCRPGVPGAAALLQG